MMIMLDPEKSGEQLRMFILDVLRWDDLEALANIVRMLNDDGTIGWRDCWPRDFAEEEVIRELGNLVRLGLVDVFEEERDKKTVKNVDYRISSASCFDRLWFHLTDKGRQAWEEWNPPDPDQAND